MQIHPTRVCPCPSALPVGFYWYGGNRKSSGGVPRWVDNLLEDPRRETTDDSDSQENEESPTNPAGPDFDGDSVEPAVVAEDTLPAEDESSSARSSKISSHVALIVWHHGAFIL